MRTAARTVPRRCVSDATLSGKQVYFNIWHHHRRLLQRLTKELVRRKQGANSDPPDRAPEAVVVRSHAWWGQVEGRATPWVQLTSRVQVTTWGPCLVLCCTRDGGCVLNQHDLRIGALFVDVQSFGNHLRRAANLTDPRSATCSWTCISETHQEAEGHG